MFLKTETVDSVIKLWHVNGIFVVGSVINFCPNKFITE